MGDASLLSNHTLAVLVEKIYSRDGGGINHFWVAQQVIGIVSVLGQTVEWGHHSTGRQTSTEQLFVFQAQYEVKGHSQKQSRIFPFFCLFLE